MDVIEEKEIKIFSICLNYKSKTKPASNQRPGHLTVMLNTDNNNNNNNVENRNKYFENYKLKLQVYGNEFKEMIKSNEYNIDLLNRFTQYLNSFKVDAYDKCLPEYDFYKGGDTVTVKFFCDDFIDEVYYNNVNVRDKVEGNVNGCCTWKALKFVGHPRAVLAIACNDNQPGTSASFAFIAKSSDPDSPWNFSSFPNDQSGRTYKLNYITINIFIYIHT